MVTKKSSRFFKKNRILKMDNFRYRVRLGLERVFNIKRKGFHSNKGGFISENFEYEFQKSQLFDLYIEFTLYLLFVVIVFYCFFSCQ